MSLYFTDAQVPELSALSQAQRRTVRRAAFEMLRQERRSFVEKRLLIICLTTFTAMLFAAWVSQVVGGSHRVLIGALIAGALTWIVLIVVESFVTERLRPYFSAYMQEHPDEITRTD